MKHHYLDQHLASTQHKITVNLIGCGGTGSHMLSSLAMINSSLVALNRQPLFVRVWDDDIVSEANIGRQLFSPADIGKHKAEVLTTRINRHYGTAWQSINSRFTNSHSDNSYANITIACVDTVKSRIDIHKELKSVIENKYLLDIGNGSNSGQILLSTLISIKQPKDGVGYLRSFSEEFPEAEDDDNLPSCSAAEALAKQDLFINKLISTYAANMLWELLKNYCIDYRGLYVNTETMKTSKIPL
jgi:PRTRC genetic system ThiF family protein